MCRTDLKTKRERAEPTEALDFEVIVDRYYSMLYRFALCLVRNVADACDLTQQTFSLWAAKGHLLRDKTKVKSWLFTTLYHEFISDRRREMRWQKEDISGVGDELPCALPETVERLEPQKVMECLQSMNETFRAPLVLFYLKEHSYEEIADILAIPVGTVMSRLSRGKQKLQNTFFSRQMGKQTIGISMIEDRST
ncbi:MAG TPA: RNA polymerase sigma factor [Candidatus Methylacidiphilales bacterium]|nr:RNA polymerase sigma factor [Candidatus Methylacidiphilales bacterium]